MSTVGKVLKAGPPQDFNPGRIARRMTLPTAGRTLVFHDEATQNSFFDFWLLEYRVNGKSLAESTDPAAAELTSAETEALEALRQSRTSLFQTETVFPNEHQVALRDLLEPHQPVVRLTDIGFSQSLSRFNIRLVVFCRLVTVRGITMTSGFSFIFQLEHLPGLLQAYRQKMKDVPPTDLPEQRFVFFFQKHRQFGEDQQYEDVV